MFDELLLHADAQMALQEILQKPSHATLLSGPRGIGSSSLAIAAAAQLLGKTIPELENAAYYRRIAPKDGTIAIETVRGLNQFFLLSVPGKAAIKRVVIIDTAEAMAREAQNALLKLLEEPPEGTVLLLVTSYPERLLATIRSRLSVVLLPAPTKQQITDWFVSKDYAETEVARTYAMTDGAIAAMLDMLSGEGNTSTFDTVRAVLGAKPFERLLQVDSLSKDKQAAHKFVTALVQAASASLEKAAQNPTSVKRWHHILAAGITAGDALSRKGNIKLVLTDLLLTL